MAARTKFTPENTAVIVAAVRSGVSFAAACRDLDIRIKTAEGWLTRGRQEERGPYSDFTAAIDAARIERERAVLSPEEFDRHLATAVRKGSVQAMKLWWDINGTPDEGGKGSGDPMDDLESADELARRRAAR